MVEVEVNQQAVDRQLKALSALMVDNPEARKRIRSQIREQIKIVRKNLSNDLRQTMKEDPRKAYRAVKSTIYRRILGANVSILNPKRAGARYQLIRNRKLDLNPHQRGGNRRERSERTNAVDSYFGKDRAFILRFLNQGTQVRYAGFGRNGRTEDQRDKFMLRTGGLGHRGSIAGRNFFGSMAAWQMDAAAEKLGKIIEEELAAAYANEIK